METESKIKLPTASELAVIAAQLRPEIDTDGALKKGLALYLRAAAYLADIESKPIEDLVPHLGDNVLFERFVVEPADRSTLLRFDPSSNDSDSVRDYLAKQNLPIKTSRAVLDSLKQFFVATALYNAKSTHDGESAYQTFLLEHEQKQEGKKVYMLPMAALDLLVKWKKRKKSEGNRKGHATRRQHDA